jgi:hypothetical protein
LQRQSVCWLRLCTRRLHRRLQWLNPGELQHQHLMVAWLPLCGCLCVAAFVAGRQP